MSEIRKAIGPSIELMIDAHGNFDVSTATELCNRMKKHNLIWFEEPLQPESIDAHRQLRKNTDINSIKLGTILVLSISFLLTQFFDRALYFWYYFGGYLLISTFVPLLCSLFNIKIFRVTKMMSISILLTFIWEIMVFYNISNLPSVYIGLSFSFLWVLMPKLKSYAF